VDHFSVIQLGISETHISLDEEFLQQLIRYLKSINLMLHCPTIEEQKQQLRNLFHGNWNAITPATEDQQHVSKLLFVENFVIQPIRLALSYSSSTETIKNEDPTAVERLMASIGVLADIEDAPVMFNGIHLKHIFTTQQDLFQRILGFYQQNAYQNVGV
jgi:hypothetical protein